VAEVVLGIWSGVTTQRKGNERERERESTAVFWSLCVSVVWLGIGVFLFSSSHALALISEVSCAQAVAQ
jgi:uncharacterized membrane protein YiaA